MAKKTRSTADTANRSTKDKKTLGSIRNLADTVVQSAERGRAPYVNIPSRSLSNVRFNQSKRIIEMGSGTNRRELFNLAQARSYMQTLLVASGCKQLIEQGKTTSIRGLFYLLKHTIEGTSEETFGTQDECDPVIEDIEVSLDSMREELHLYAKNAGAMVGPITVVDSGDTIDCSRMGSGGYSIPSIVEQDIVQFKKSTAKFILHVEKDTVWRRFNEDKFWRKHNCILTHGGGQPPRGVRRMLHRLHHELRLPVYCLLDNDPWGYYIYSVLKQGSINLAYESRRMAIPEARYLGLRSLDYGRCQLSPSVQIKIERAGHQTGAADRAVSVVLAQKALAEGDRADVEERLQARSRSPDQQRHQLCYGRIRAGPVGGERVPRLADGSRIS
jgi:DNA topoisomerase-6 subunit A